MDNEIDRKIDVTAILFLLIQNRQQTHDWTLMGSGAKGLGIQKCNVEDIVGFLGLKVLKSNNSYMFSWSRNAPVTFVGNPQFIKISIQNR